MKLPKEWKKESLKSGRRKIGTVLTLPDGRKALAIERSMRDVWRGKDAPYVSQSMQTGDAGWSVERSTLSLMKMKGIGILLIHVRQDKSFYATTLQRYIDHSKVRSQRTKNGSVQRTLTFDFFRKISGMAKV